MNSESYPLFFLNPQNSIVGLHERAGLRRLTIIPVPTASNFRNRMPPAGVQKGVMSRSRLVCQLAFTNKSRWKCAVPAGLLAVLIFFTGMAGAAETDLVIDLPENHDAARDRNVPLTFHLPEQTNARPLVLISHGGAGSRNGMYALASKIARRGYVVLCLEHVTSNTDDIRRRMRSQGIGFREALIECGDDMIPRKNRPLDVRFAIDLAEKWNREDERLKGRIDLSKIAILGHSYGAYTAMVCCGAKPVGIDDDLAEPRITMGIALSPQSANGNFFDADSFSKVTRPFAGISGTGDLAGDGHRDFFRLMPKGEKHLLWFHDAHHFSFSDPTGGPRTGMIKADTDVTKALQVIVPEILDRYLQGEPALDESARAVLVSKSLGGKVRRIEWEVK